MYNLKFLSIDLHRKDLDWALSGRILDKSMHPDSGIYTSIGAISVLRNAPT
jgi:hypothetical protein